MPKNQYAIARRSIWYLLRTLLVIALIVVLCLTAFVTAMHISNIYILVTEGLELRAGYILQGGEIAHGILYRELHRSGPGAVRRHLLQLQRHQLHI